MYKKLFELEDKTEIAAKIEGRIVKKVVENRLSPVLENEGFFYADPFDVEFPTFLEILNDLPYTFDNKGKKKWKLEYEYKEAKGVTVAQLLSKKYSPNKPTLVFHHGLGDVKGNVQARILSNGEFFELFNVISIKAAHHNGVKDFKRNCMNTFLNFTVSNAASVHIMEEMRKVHNNLSEKPTVITGFSMGGVLSSWHYLFFNTAEFYFPIISYPEFSEIIFAPEHKAAINQYEKRIKNKSYTDCYKVPEELKDKQKDNVVVFLGINDEIIFYDRAKKYWEGFKVHSYPVGHFSIVLKMSEIRKEIKKVVFGN